MATRYLVPGGDGNYDSTSNWSATSGGASGASFPTSVDDIIIDFYSANANITVNVLSACKSFNASNYTGTWTISNNFSVNGTTSTGNITLSSGMTITGSASFIKVPTSSTGVITSNGVIFDCNFIFQNNNLTTITTITGQMQVNGNVTIPNTSNITTLNGSAILVGGDIIYNNTVAGTSTFQMIGSATATFTAIANRYLQNNLVINKGLGILNINDLYWGAATRTLTYTSGVINHTGTLFVATNGTLNTNGLTWNIVNPLGNISFTSILNADTISKSSGSINFQGPQPFVINHLSIPSAAATVSFANGLTCTINQSLKVYMTSSGTFRGTVAPGCNLDVAQTATVALYGGKFLHINARVKALRVYKPVSFTNTQNIFSISGNISQTSSTR